MFWKRKLGPKLGDKRTLRPFAILPVKCDDGTTVWLERFEADYEYRKHEWSEEVDVPCYGGGRTTERHVRICWTGVARRRIAKQVKP